MGIKITINAGHCLTGGIDRGAEGPSGLQEAMVTFDLMRRVADYLRPIGYDVLEIQDDDLSVVTEASNQFGAAMFLSIHCNSATSSAAHGTETFCYHLLGESAKLATCVQTQLVDTLKTADRGVKTANFQVLRETDCPAILIEVAFIKNEIEEAMLADPIKRDIIAASIARGVTDYGVPV